MVDQNPRHVTGLFIFCEGPHDVAFVRQVLKYCFGVTRAKGANGKDPTFSEFPAPLDKLFKTSMEKHAMGDLSLDMAHKFFLPDRLLRKNDCYILLFNSGGKNKTEIIKGFLKDFLVLHPDAATFASGAGEILGEVHYLFTYDADHLPATDTVRTMSQALANIEDIEDTLWSLETMTLQEQQHGTFKDNKGFYIWANNQDRGSLEDLVSPMFRESKDELYTKAETIIDDMFSWETDNEKEKEAFSAACKRKKAILTTMGQKKKPGGSLNVIIDQAGLLNKTAFQNSAPVSAFVDFLNAFTKWPVNSQGNQ
ncbi:DUF3226 domain-containing protein [Sulfidibacter corallicola]|uniref:Uncharacterized protein n=1 Tax=Sulfidibacter corallicola TaxID=2818388 RepID=A0A8A4TP61_SULCO|nr:DUF3226 domain-containing protein [Sulfidibacter corallicola]QTD50748.1 hypothetical protein J3U87_34620 [Sulfidibacter corallicola]